MTASRLKKLYSTLYLSYQKEGHRTPLQCELDHTGSITDTWDMSIYITTDVSIALYEFQNLLVPLLLCLHILQCQRTVHLFTCPSSYLHHIAHTRL